MGKIFCVMGKSASGKDTIYNKILQDDSLMLSRIIPYTTRPIRDGETQDKDYPVSYTHLPSPRDYAASRMPSSA